MSHMTSMLAAPLPRRATLTFGALSALGLIAAARQIALLAPGLPQPGVVSGAVAVDLTVVLTVFVWWIVGRELRWSPLAMAPLFLASLVLAGRVLPGPTPALTALHILALPAELVAVAWAVKRLRSSNRVRHVLEYELDVLRTALGGWRAPVLPAESLTYHRRAGYGAVVAALIMAMAAEILAVHLVVSCWSDRGAWAFTALGLYGLLWILGDWKACRSRPVTLAGGEMRIRFGLRWRLDIPVERIVALRGPSTGGVATPPEVDLRLALPGTSPTVLELDSAVTARGPYGIQRKVRTLALALDDPARLHALVARLRPTSNHETHCP